MADDIIQLTTEIVANYVSGNKTSAAELPGIIASVHQALANIDTPQPETGPEVEKPTAAQIRKSIKPDGLVSFEDGKTYQTLKRHLTGRGLSIGEYKAKWGLPRDYPSTAPSYSAKRSEMAKSIGLGQGGRGAAAQASTPAPKAKKSSAKAAD